MDNHKNGKMESKPSIQPADHLNNNPDFHLTGIHLPKKLHN
ncbi:hypothetical protein [Candidatus Protochlamydia sp. W-9]|nr:hypothetical protein [Candidatus Protochlamydia sp. W-9]